MNSISNKKINQVTDQTRCFIPHMEKLASTSLPMPQTVIAVVKKTMYMQLVMRKSPVLSF